MEMIMRAYPNDWVSDSIMYKKGVAKAPTGKVHNLTAEVQGTYIYTIGPYSDPVLEVDPGDTVVVETQDAFEGALKSESDRPSDLLRMPYLNPQAGPIMVRGAQPGDTVCVHIQKMVPRGEQPRGTCCIIEEFGALTGTNLTATLNEPLPEIVRKIPVDEQIVHWSDKVKLPYRPHIGTLSCSPEIDSINSLTPDSHGGNMDLPDMGPGTVTYLPVRVEGARVFIGDAHACQGDGEVCGVAVEYPTFTTITLNLIKDQPIEWPRLEGDDFLMAIGSTRPLEDAGRIAFRELIYWLERDYGFERYDAYMMLGQCAKVRLGNFVDPKYTMGAAMPKCYLP